MSQVAIFATAPAAAEEIRKLRVEKEELKQVINRLYEQVQDLEDQLLQLHYERLAARW